MENVPIFIQPLNSFLESIPNLYLNVASISKIERHNNSTSSVFVDGVEYFVYNENLYQHIKIEKNDINDS